MRNKLYQIGIGAIVGTALLSGTAALAEEYTGWTAGSEWTAAPSTEWSAPETEWSAPATEWSAPATEWSAPATEWSAPATEWSAPATEWSAPATEWSAPATEWSAPATEPTAPVTGAPATEAPVTGVPATEAPVAETPAAVQTDAASEAAPAETTAAPEPAAPTVSTAPDAFPTADLGISAQGYCLINASTGEVIVGKEINTQMKPASITKILTALVAVEHTASLDERVVFSQTALTQLGPMSSTLSPIPQTGESISMNDALYALMMKSANECGNAIAEHVGGSISGFADLMNQKAAELGAVNSHFVNPHGLDNDDHYTTPYDIAIITKAALQNPTVLDLMSVNSHVVAGNEFSKERTLNSGHSMINGQYPYDGVFAGKTGYTVGAQWTLVTAAKRGDVSLIAVVMKCDEGCNYADTKVLLDYGFAVTAGQLGTNGYNVYDPQVSDMTSDGFTVTWKVGSDAVKADFPVWTDLNGTDDLTKEEGTIANGTVSYRVEASAHQNEGGIYTVQAYTYNAAGESMVNTIKVLMDSTTKKGFYKKNGGTYYIKDNGALALNWLETEDGCYFFNYNTGLMYTGWTPYGATVFYLKDNGQLYNGWVNRNNDIYYFQVTGDMAVGQVQINGIVYYFDEQGKLIQGTASSRLGELVRKSIQQ